MGSEKGVVRCKRCFKKVVHRNKINVIKEKIIGTFVREIECDSDQFEG